MKQMQYNKLTSIEHNSGAVVILPDNLIHEGNHNAMVDLLDILDELTPHTVDDTHDIHTD